MDDEEWEAYLEAERMADEVHAEWARERKKN